jgi:exodeoxyribonuclease-1
MRSQKFIFYDTETSGLNKMFGQIFQFAATLTDENFQILDQFEIRSRRMPHIVPDPGALLVTGVTPEQLESATDTYYSFASKIRRKLLSWSPAIFAGYNIFSFDEHFMRSMYYQNLFPPYLSQTNGNKRLDVLPLVRAAEQLFPDSLNFQVNQRGKTSKKLQHVAAANGFSNHNAHDAMGDVLATIHVAEILKHNAPKLWHNSNKANSRRDFNQLIENDPWVLIHDHNNGWPITYPAVSVCKVDNGRNTLFYDLRYPPNKISNNDPFDNFTSRLRPFRVVRDAEMPITFRKTELKLLNLLEPLDCDELDYQAREIKGNEAIFHAAQLYSEAKREFDKSPHIEEQIYDDFDAFDRDRGLIEKFHEANPDGKLGIAKQFSDERFRAFARRIIYENFPAAMQTTEREMFGTKIKERLNTKDDVPWTTLEQAISECDKLFATSGSGNRALFKIKQYLQQMRG